MYQLKFIQNSGNKEKNDIHLQNGEGAGTEACAQLRTLSSGGAPLFPELGRSFKHIKIRGTQFFVVQMHRTPEKYTPRTCHARTHTRARRDNPRQRNNTAPTIGHTREFANFLTPFRLVWVYSTAGEFSVNDEWRSMLVKY